MNDDARLSDPSPLFVAAALSPTATQTKAPFRPDIEGLRAIAVIAVVAFHYGAPGFGGGYVGVDVFFVISGYLISGLLIDEIASTGRIDMAGFYGRRARRLLPAALLMVCASLVAGAWILSPLKQFAVLKGAAASSAYVSNLWFLYENFGYFSPESALNPYLHTWSLSVEEQFYFLWPACLLFIHSRRLLTLRLLYVIMICTLISFLLCVWLTSVRQPWAFYLLPTRVWEFGIGALGSLAPVRERMKSLGAAPLIGWVGMLLTVVACAISYESSHFPGPDSLLAAGAAATVLAAGSNPSRRGPRVLLGTIPFKFIGKLSYSIYLWHWPIFVFALAVAPAMSSLGRVACAILTLGFAMASYKYLERPVRESRWLGSKPKRSLNLAVVLTAAGILFASAAALLANHFASAPMQLMIDRQTSESSIASASGNHCLVGFTSASPTTCVFGSAEAPVTIALFGDSHADQWSTPLVMFAVKRHWRVVTYLKASCSVADIPVYNFRLMRFSPECRDWREDAIARIIQLQPSAVIVTEFSSGYIKGNLSSLGEHAVDLRTWIKGLSRSLLALHDAHIPIILIRDTPTPNKNIRDCLANADWWSIPESSCDVARSVAIDEEVTTSERALVQSILGAHFIDLSSDICDAYVCEAIRNDIVVYRDANHLTNRYAARLAGPLSEALLPIIGIQAKVEQH